MSERVGVFGGTFDPVHLGHLRVAEEALEILDLTRVLFVPSADPPHKTGTRVSAFDHRWHMLELATLEQPRFHLSDVEHRLGGKSYTVVTLRTLLQQSAGVMELFFLLGLDSFLDLDSWWHYREIFRLSRVAILLRPGSDPRAIAAFLEHKVSPEYRWDEVSQTYLHGEMLPVHRLSNTLLGISSTRVRHLVQCRKSIRYLVPSTVEGYLREHRLYV